MSVVDALEDLVLFDFAWFRILFTLFWEHLTIIYVFGVPSTLPFREKDESPTMMTTNIRNSRNFARFSISTNRSGFRSSQESFPRSPLNEEFSSFPRNVLEKI
jgi:hypothetical protein